VEAGAARLQLETPLALATGFSVVAQISQLGAVEIGTVDQGADVEVLAVIANP